MNLKNINLVCAYNLIRAIKGVEGLSCEIERLEDWAAKSKRLGTTACGNRRNLGQSGVSNSVTAKMNSVTAEMNWRYDELKEDFEMKGFWRRWTQSIGLQKNILRWKGFGEDELGSLVREFCVLYATLPGVLYFFHYRKFFFFKKYK
jgi:hypothetical protein